MRYEVYSATELTQYPICILIPTIRKEEIKKAYIDPFGIDKDEVLILDLHQAAGKKKTPMAEMKAYIEEELRPVIQDCGVQYLIVADADYFKALTGSAKIDANLGYILNSSLIENVKVVYVPNHKAIFYDPEKVRVRIAQGIEALLEHRKGSYQTPGTDIIKFAAYPRSYEEIELWLEKLLEMDCDLTCDIEAFSLKHHTAGIGTITFCWSKHEGIAFPVDYECVNPNNPFESIDGKFGRQVKNERVRSLLLNFFRRFKRNMTYHSISFDVYVMIYQLFMGNLLDTQGLLNGLEVMLRNWDDTKLITYLATNSCAGNHLSLKSQAQEYAGNYGLGEDIKDITKIDLHTLLQYNLVDGLSTWFTKEKHWNTMIVDQQLEIYETIFKPAIVDIIQMQLTGMPVNMKRAIEVNEKLTAEENITFQKIMASPIIQQYNYRLEEQHIAKRNAKLKKKQIVFGEEPQTFNPNSDLQMRDLLFEVLQLPVINLTDSKLPSTDGETIEALLNRTEDPVIKDLLEAFQMYAIVGTLTTNFMPAILNAVEGPDGWHYLFGNFNLGGTLSGRLSSSGPNLQNLPSTGKGHKIKLLYAKLIKSCFQAPPGWLFVGIDFASLEDRISALTTKDPNKLKVYTDGYDGHSLRALAYFGDQMPLIKLSEARRVFKIIQDGEIHHLFEGEQVTLPNGGVVKVEELFST